MKTLFPTFLTASYLSLAIFWPQFSYAADEVSTSKMSNIVANETKNTNNNDSTKVEASAESVKNEIIKNDLEIYCQPFMQQDLTAQLDQGGLPSATNLMSLQDLFAKTDLAIKNKFSQDQSKLQDQIHMFEKADSIKELEKKLNDYQTRPEREQQQKAEELEKDLSKKAEEQQKTDLQINKQLEAIRVEENKKTSDSVKKEMVTEKLNKIARKIEMSQRIAKRSKTLPSVDTGKRPINPAAMVVPGRKVKDSVLASSVIAKSILGGKIIAGTRAQYLANKSKEQNSGGEGSSSLAPVVIAPPADAQKVAEDNRASTRQKICDEKGFTAAQCDGYFKIMQETYGGSAEETTSNVGSVQKLPELVIKKLENNYDKILGMSDDELYQTGLQAIGAKK